MIAMYPGSFDPPTLGHLDLIERASKMFSELYVAVMINSKKKNLLSIEERIEVIERLTEKYKNVKVISFKGLTTVLAREIGAHVLVRGLRATYDLEYEMQMASVNRKLAPEIETIYIPAREKLNFISSSICKEVALHGGEISIFVPEEVEEIVRKKVREEA